MRISWLTSKWPSWLRDWWLPILVFPAYGIGLLIWAILDLDSPWLPNFVATLVGILIVWAVIDLYVRRRLAAPLRKAGIRAIKTVAEHLLQLVAEESLNHIADPPLQSPSADALLYFWKRVPSELDSNKRQELLDECRAARLAVGQIRILYGSALPPVLLVKLDELSQAAAIPRSASAAEEMSTDREWIAWLISTYVDLAQSLCGELDVLLWEFMVYAHQERQVAAGQEL